MIPQLRRVRFVLSQLLHTKVPVDKGLCIIRCFFTCLIHDVHPDGQVRCEKHREVRCFFASQTLLAHEACDLSLGHPGQLCGLRSLWPPGPGEWRYSGVTRRPAVTSRVTTEALGVGRTARKGMAFASHI